MMSWRLPDGIVYWLVAILVMTKAFNMTIGNTKLLVTTIISND